MKLVLTFLLISTVVLKSVATDFREIVINEIYAAGFPNKEFIELYNTTGSPIDIGGFTINDKTIANYSIPAQGFVAIGKSSIITEFVAAGISVTSATSFPTLTNGGLSLILKDSDGNLVDGTRMRVEMVVALHLSRSTRIFPVVILTIGQSQMTVRVGHLELPIRFLTLLLTVLILV